MAGGFWPNEPKGLAAGVVELPNSDGAAGVAEGAGVWLSADFGVDCPKRLVVGALLSLLPPPKRVAAGCEVPNGGAGFAPPNRGADCEGGGPAGVVEKLKGDGFLFWAGVKAPKFPNMLAGVLVAAGVCAGEEGAAEVSGGAKPLFSSGFFPKLKPLVPVELAPPPPKRLLVPELAPPKLKPPVLGVDAPPAPPPPPPPNNPPPVVLLLLLSPPEVDVRLPKRPPPEDDAGVLPVL